MTSINRVLLVGRVTEAVAPIPEPSSMVLLGLGGMGLLGITWFRKRVTA